MGYGHRGQVLVRPPLEYFASNVSAAKIEPASDTLTAIPRTPAVKTFCAVTFPPVETVSAADELPSLSMVVAETDPPEEAIARLFVPATVTAVNVPPFEA